MSISIDVERLGNHTLVRVAGEVDLATAPELSAALEAVLSNGFGLVVDLESVEFIDTSGLRVLLSGYERAKEGGMQYHLVAPDGPARRVLDLTGLSKELSVLDSLDDLPA